MKKPALVIMAAGMGSRYGGLKQIDPIDEQGHIIMDFSVFDAMRAGFGKVIFIIKKQNEADFRHAIGSRMEKLTDVAYAYQELDALPAGYRVPAGREKPWGTAHAILCAADRIDGPFAVLNADDYYGPEAFRKIYDYLSSGEDGEKYRYAMVGYRLKNTVTEHGYVARGICETDRNGFLTGIQERTRIEVRNGGIQYSEDDGQSWKPLDGETIVSMNLWGFTPSILEEIKNGFPEFLERGLRENPLKCEYFLPEAVSRLLACGKAEAAVLTSSDKWYGVTYREDKPDIVEAIRRLKAEGIYPPGLWEAK